MYHSIIEGSPLASPALTWCLDSVSFTVYAGCSLHISGFGQTDPGSNGECGGSYTWEDQMRASRCGA